MNAPAIKNPKRIRMKWNTEKEKEVKFFDFSSIMFT